MGARPYEEIKVILNEADIVLHVESFEKEQMEAVKYSFSTKIIDCLQSGSVVVGIGPSGIASIEYLRRVPGTIIIDTERTLEERIEEVLNESCNYISNADKTRRFAINNHSIESVRTSLRREFRMIINDE
jgi:chlorite dismutase